MGFGIRGMLFWHCQPRHDALASHGIALASLVSLALASLGSLALASLGSPALASLGSLGITCWQAARASNSPSMPLSSFDLVYSMGSPLPCLLASLSSWQGRTLTHALARRGIALASLVSLALASLGSLALASLGSLGITCWHAARVSNSPSMPLSSFALV